VFNVLLQILDDGRLTDSQGRTVDFKNTIIIMTSNIGSQHLLAGITEDGQIPEQTREQVMSLLRSHFRPEFLNRVDEVVLFSPLLLEEIKKIIDLLLADLRKRLEDRKIDLDLTEQARDFIAREAYDPVYGARPLRRYLQHNLETRLARELIRGTLQEGAKVTVDVENGTLTFV
jgi:ATP-dependent Clp protease ATP-binding subunit ClpB